MRDEDKSKEQLISELMTLRTRVTQLESQHCGCEINSRKIETLQPTFSLLETVSSNHHRRLETLPSSIITWQEQFEEQKAALREAHNDFVSEVIERCQAEKELGLVQAQLGLIENKLSHVQDKLGLAQDQLKTVLDATPGIVSWISADLRYINVNHQLAALFDLTPEDFAGQDIGFLGSSSDFNDFIRDFFKSNHHETSREVSAKIKGDLHHYLVVAEKYDHNRAAFVIGIDITQRRRAEQALSLANNQLQTLVEATPGIVSWISSDLRYLGVNHRLAKLFERQPRDFIGKDIGFLGSSSKFNDFIREFFKSPKTEESRKISAQIKGETRHFLVVAHKYDHNRAAFVVGVDVTERHQARKALRLANSKLKTLVEATPGMVSWISSDLRYLGVNHHLAELFDLPADAFEGQDIGFLQSSPEFKDWIQKFFTQADKESCRQICARIRGENRYFLMVARKYDHNCSTFVVGIDITDHHQAKQALRLAKDQLQTVLDATPGIVSWISSDLRYLEVNHHLAEMFDLSPEEFVGQPLGFLKSSNDFSNFIRNFFASSSQNIHREITATVKGENKNYLIVARKYNQDQAVFVIGIDITQRKNTEQALEQAEIKYRNIFENAVEGIFQTTLDGYYLSANPALARIYGYDSPQELMTKLTSLGEQLYLAPNRRAQFIQLLDEQGVVLGFESQVHRKDGTIIWISENARSVCDHSGRFLYYEGSVEDITEHKHTEEQLKQLNEQLENRVEERTAALRASNHHLRIEVTERQHIEDALRKSEAELRVLFGAMTDIINVFDDQGRYVKVVSTNSEVLYSPHQDRLGKKVHDILPQDIADYFVYHIQQVLETGETVHLEYCLPSQDEQGIWFSANVSPLPDNCVIWVARNITERRRMVHALERAEEKYRSIFENAAEGIFQTTPDGRCLSANPALVKMYGYSSPEELTENQLNIRENLYVEPQRQTELSQLLEDQGAVSNFKSQVYRKDGNIIWTSENVRLVRDHHGQPMYYEGTVQDITERKRSVDALRAEQEKSERLLLNILPKPIAEKLKDNHSYIAERFEEATILFADIVEFTNWAAEIQPTRLVELLNQIFSSFDQLADQYNLEKIKTIGDAYMIVGGLPTPRTDHCEAIAEMARAMQREIQGFRRDDGSPFRLRIGIHSGPVVAGVIGKRKFIYDLWGDAVNVASRMESHGQAGRIQISEDTYQHLQGKYQFEQRGLIDIKGKGKMMTYWLTGEC